MPASATERLRHVKNAIGVIRQGLSGLTLDVVELEPFVLGGLSYQLLVISEAARHVPQEWKDAYAPDLDWRGIADIGNRLRHAYQQVNIDILWAVYLHDLDPLEAAIDAMLAAHGENRQG
jgi:uncharacterized protein with HEPN domain